MKAIRHLSNTFKIKLRIACLTIRNHPRLLNIPCSLLLLVIILSSCDFSKGKPTTSTTKSDSFDFSQYDFSTNKLVNLDGNWDFYWNELLSPSEILSGKYEVSSMKVPHNWNIEQEHTPAYPVYGFATYQTKVKISPDTPPLLLSTLFLPTSSAIFINDELVAEYGKVSRSKEFQTFNMYPIHQIVEDVGTEFTITIQIANYDLHKGGILHNVSLGNANYELHKIKRAHFFNLLVVGGFSFLGLFFMLTVFMKYFNNRLFYFGLLIASFGYWKGAVAKVYHYFFPNWDWLWSLKIEFISIFIFNFALIRFINSIYPKQNWKPFVYFTQGLEIILILATILLPIHIIFPIVGFHLNWIGIEFIYIVLVLFRAIKTKDKSIHFVIWGLVGGLLNFTIYVLQDKNIIPAQEAIFFVTNIVLLLMLGLLVVDKLFFDFANLIRRTEVALRVKSQFSSMVSHEMRTPMNAIIGMTDLLAKTPLSKTQAEYLDSIQISGNSLITIIDDILDNTRIQEGKIRIEHKVFDLYALLKQIYKTFQKEVDEKAIRLELDIHPDVPQYVKSDPTRIRQILDNLVSNAVKFTKRGYIKITLNLEKINDQRIELHFKVEDTGIGIAAENLASIFDQFSQEDSSLSRRHMGIGLGLSICRQLSSILGGEIKVESEEGEGSTFHCFLIVEERKALPYTLEYLPKEDASNTLKILVAEDNLLNRKLILTGLKNIGYQADSVTNGYEVLDACEKKTYDLIFMDVQMPEMDGLEATKLLVNQKRESQRPCIVALTANAFPEDRSAALQAGMDDYLVKPVKLERIQQLLYKLEYEKKHCVVLDE